MMNKIARTPFLRLLAPVCFAGATFCCSLVSGQQLLPKEQPAEKKLPQETAPQSSIRIALKPLAPMPPTTQQAIPLKPLKTAAPAEPVPVIKPVMVAKEEATAAEIAPSDAPVAKQVIVEPTGPAPVAAPSLPVAPTMESTAATDTNLNKGKNFPADAEQRIAEFLKTNKQTLPAAPATDSSAPRVAKNESSLPVASAVVPATTQAPQNFGRGLPLANVPPNPVTTPASMQFSNPRAPMVPMASIGGAGSIGNPNPMVGQQEMILTAPGEADFFDAENAVLNDPTTEVLVDYGAQSATFDCCGFITSSRYYAVYDTLNFQRNDGIFRASNITTLDNYGFQFGARATIGKKRDATRGYEGTFMGFDPWIATSTQTNAAGSLVGALYPLSANNLPPSAYSAFQNGTYAQQWNKTRLYSLAFNKTWWGSDVVKAFVGGRYINFQDDFRLSMANINGEQGYHSIQGRNQMFGVHTGMEVLYDIGYRLSFSYAWKLGGYANAARNTVTHINDGQLRGFGGIEKTDFAWSAEFGVWGRYKISPNIRLRAGYELFSLFNVYDSESLYSTRFGNRMPNLENQGDAIFHGPSMGFEIYR